MLSAQKSRIMALILMLVVFCCHIPAGAAANDDPRYKVFKSKPWPIEVVSNIPFDFEVSDKYKKAKIKAWSALLKKENNNPTFKREVLHVNDVTLAAYWKDLFDRLLFAELEEKLTYVNYFMNRFDYGEDINV